MPEQSYGHHSKSFNAPHLVSGLLLAVVLAGLALGVYMGSFGYALMFLALFSGLGYSIWRVHRSTKQLDSKRHALSVLVVNALMLMVLGVAVPVVVIRERAISPPPDWRPYVSVNGRYSIELPGDAHEKQRQVQTPTGPLTINIVMAYLGQNGEYMSSYLNLSGRRLTLSDDEFLDQMFQQAMSQETSVVLNKKPLAFNSANGLTVKAMEAELKLDEKAHGKNAFSIVRLYWVKDRATVYMNVATTLRSPVNEATVAKFHDSFQLRASGME